MPERVETLGYDLDRAIMSNDSDILIVDVGGGRGEMLLEVKEAYPHLEASNLVLQEFEPDFKIRGLTVMKWDFKDGSTQPIRGAMMYSHTHFPQSPRSGGAAADEEDLGRYDTLFPFADK